jgi:hypothetical protein
MEGFQATVGRVKQLKNQGWWGAPQVWESLYDTMVLRSCAWVKTAFHSFLSSWIGCAKWSTKVGDDICLGRRHRNAYRSRASHALWTSML